MGRIRRLDDALVVLIAAGEVVEGPWSVVKELMENSLDAGAGRVEVSVSGGGFESIVVGDDGCGMDADDLALAFERYATSKLAAAADLDAIATLGFRGEALAAIAAVSRVSVRTRSENDDIGLSADVSDGRVRVRPEGASRGTIVTVRDLYAKVPARRKFAGDAGAEYRKIADVFKRLSLAATTPAFSLTREGKLQYVARGHSTRRDRVGEVLGWEYLDDLVQIDATEGDMTISAFVSSPRVSFIGTGNMYTIVNGRPVRAKPVFKAVMSAYDPRIERGRYPLAVVYLQLPERDVDVNVHPRKEEVRLADGNRVAEFIGRLIRAELTRHTVSVPAGDFYPPSRNKTLPGAHDVGAAEGAVAVTPRIRAAVEGYLKNHGLWPGADEPTFPAPSVTTSGGQAIPGFPEGAIDVLGQLDGTYIIVKRGRNLVVIDQHTAHERVIYDRLVGQPWPLQGLLLPISLTLPPPAAADLKECLPALVAAGFDVEEFGANTFIIRALPALPGLGDAGAFLREVANDCAQGGKPASASALRDVVFRSISCHAAVKAGDSMALDEMGALVADLFASPTPDVCPHGRPTMVRLETKQLGKLFKR